MPVRIDPNPHGHLGAWATGPRVQCAAEAYRLVHQRFIIPGPCTPTLASPPRKRGVGG